MQILETVLQRKNWIIFRIYNEIGYFSRFFFLAWSESSNFILILLLLVQFFPLGLHKLFTRNFCRFFFPNDTSWQLGGARDISLGLDWPRNNFGKLDTSCWVVLSVLCHDGKRMDPASPITHMHKVHVMDISLNTEFNGIEFNISLRNISPFVLNLLFY